MIVIDAQFETGICCLADRAHHESSAWPVDHTPARLAITRAITAIRRMALSHVYHLIATSGTR